MEIIFSAIIGLCIGSFLNVCIYRIPREESIVFPASHCTVCSYELQKRDLIPVLSYIFLKGKCRECGTIIPIKYPLVEILNSLLYVLVYFSYGNSINFIKGCLLSSLLIVIAGIDLKTHYIYKSTTIFGIVSSMVMIIITFLISGQIPWSNILGGILGALIIKAIVFSTGAMGEGDIDISLIIGLFLGIKGVILSLLIAFILGGIIASLILILKLKERKSEIAFGPYLAMGAIISLLYGTQIINWYMSFIKV
ncbi:MAG: prepilin peptidase [Clostridium sp.]|nr:prepilin peptidase [Clostridium sp.]